MKRVLRFGRDERSSQRFQMLWTGFNLSSPEGRRGPGEIRAEGQILDALESISVEDREQPSFGADVPHRLLTMPDDQPEAVLTLTQQQLDLLTRYVAPPCVEWKPAIARRVVDLLDFLAAAERVDA